MMKRLLWMLAVGVIALGLAGCGSEEEASQAREDDFTGPPAQAPPR
jgi:ABC-type glycerol-3-phosphate transport system substrate-binding protein